MPAKRRGGASRITANAAWGNVGDLDFREYVAREIVDKGMPVTYIHRNHAIPLSAVKRWVDKFRKHGRAGLVDEGTRGFRKP